MALDVVFRPEAEANLNSLYNYIVEHGGLGTAGRYMERIEAACLSLATFPERGRRRDELQPGLRTIGFERRVTIAYRMLGDTLEIVAVVYGGRDFESLFRSGRVTRRFYRSEASSFAFAQKRF